MTKDEAIDSVRTMARAYANTVQEKSDTMTGTELYAEKKYIPDFAIAREQKNMLERTVGFVCRAPSGRVVKLLQPYDSSVYTGEPETLPAQWGFKWSTNPDDALPFVAISTSPYGIDDCCTENGKTYRSKIANNIYAPSSYPAGWEELTGGGGDTSQTEAIPEFVQPTGTHDAYNKGDKVTFEGKHYISLIDANVYSPAAYPAGWQEISS